MRITNNNPNVVQDKEISSTQKAKGNQKNSDIEKISIGDNAKTEISARAREMAKAESIAKATPEVREEMIAELKRRIANKEYNVKSDAIADRMVKEHLRDIRR